MCGGLLAIFQCLQVSGQFIPLPTTYLGSSSKIIRVLAVSSVPLHIIPVALIPFQLSYPVFWIPPSQ